MSGAAAVLARFQSAANIERMARALTSYFTDRMNVALDKALGPNVVYETVAEATRMQLPPAADVDTLNKYVGVRLRERFLGMLKEAQQAQAAQPPAPQVPPQAPPPAQSTDVNADVDDFYYRLQDVEVARQRISDIPVTPAAQATPDVVEAAPAIPAAVSTVFMPTPPKRGQALCIRSFARPWQTGPSPRAVLPWEGPLPPFIDATGLRLVACQLPSFVADLTPYVRLAIDGVGGATTECVLLPTHDGGRWKRWAPAAESLSYLVPVPCPWTIRLFDAAGQLLDMGFDGVEDVGSEAFGDAGDKVWIQTANRVTTGWLKKDDDGVLNVEGAGAGSTLLNWHRQWTLHLEIAKKT